MSSLQQFSQYNCHKLSSFVSSSLQSMYYTNQQSMILCKGCQVIGVLCLSTNDQKQSIKTNIFLAYSLLYDLQ